MSAAPRTPRGNVLVFPRFRSASPFDELTAALVLKRHHEGTLDAAVVEYLLAAVGLGERL